MCFFQEHETNARPIQPTNMRPVKLYRPQDKEDWNFVTTLHVFFHLSKFGCLEYLCGYIAALDE